MLKPFERQTYHQGRGCHYHLPGIISRTIGVAGFQIIGIPTDEREAVKYMGWHKVGGTQLDHDEVEDKI
jgi:hypothetical protein